MKQTNFHTHTSRCHHAFGNDEEFVRTAIQNGFEVLGFSDHACWKYDSDFVAHMRMKLDEFDDYKDKVNIIVVFSKSGSSLDKVKEYTTKNGYTYPTYYDADGTIARGFGVTGFPFNLTIDNGKVVKQLELPTDYEMMVRETGVQ